MLERIEKEFKNARKLSLIGAALLYAISLYCFLVVAVYVYSLFSIRFPVEMTGMRWIIAFSSHASITGSVLLLAEFLRHFSAGSSPFCKAQSRRLQFAAALFLVRSVIDQIVPSFNPVPVGTTGITLVPQSGLDLKVVVMVVFLVCLAMVVRYGDALKEDSDAFV